MKIKMLQRFLIIKYSIGGIITLLLFLMVFLTYNFLDSSLEVSNQTLSSLSAIRDSVITIKSNFNAYINEPQIHAKNAIKKNLDELILKLKNNHHIKQLALDKNLESISDFSSELKLLRVELQNITVQYRLLSQEDKIKNQFVYIEPIKNSLYNIDHALSNLNTYIIADQRTSVSDFGKYNLIMLLAALLSLHLIVIFIFKPISKTVLSVVSELERVKEEALNSAHAKSDYLATLSHQIRTPLNGVLGLSGLVLETNLNKEQREYLELIQDSGENLLQIINDIFNYSKIESGQMELDELYFSIHQCLDEIVDTFIPKCREKKLELLCIIEPDVPEFILGDSDKIKQCLAKLVSNSIKFTRRGEILIRVNLLNKTDNRYEIQMSVSDTGIGIPEAKLKTLFNPLPQSEAPASRRFEGTGLGLAIVSRLVRMMNGRVWVESEMNKGSTFYMAIFFQADSTGNTLWDEKDISILARKHVLILDASENNRKIISLQCHEWLMQPRSLQSEEELFEVLTKEPDTDFIFVDYDMLKNQLSAFKSNLGSLNVHQKFQIIYMINSANTPDDKEELFIQKPIRKTQLLTVLLNSQKQQNQKHPDVEDAADGIEKISDLKILLAEDNVINQKLLERMIARMGYPIDIAQDGQSAVKMAHRNHYDLIFMDLQMPEMDGLEATKAILQSTSGKKPKIIAMTANVTKKDKELCFEAGMIDYLPKPVNFNKVKSIIDHWQEIKANEKM